MLDLSDARSEAGGVVWERRSLPGASFYGLGPRTDATFDLRGKSVRAEVPFLVSTSGYGEYHPGAGTYHFDFTDETRYRIQGPEIDYYFYYGPTPKEIFEEHNLDGNHPDPWSVAGERFGSWATLKASLLRIVHGAMSAATAPMFNLAAYNTAPPELQARARQLGSLVARVSPGTVGLSGFRNAARHVLRQLHRRVAGPRLPDLASPALPGTRRPRGRAPHRRIPAGRRDADRADSTNPATSAASTFRAATGPIWKPTS